MEGRSHGHTAQQTFSTDNIYLHICTTVGHSIYLLTKGDVFQIRYAILLPIIQPESCIIRGKPDRERD